MMHLINIYARLRKSNEIKTALRIFFEHFVRLNFTTCLNLSTTVFQIDANLGYISALYEMIIYTEEALLILLPCLPVFWKRGHAENILLKGNRIIKEMAWDDENVNLSIISYNDSVITVKYGNEERLVSLEKEKIKKISFKVLS